MHNRPDERKELIRLFRLGTSVQLLAPRRIGKTWLMYTVAEDLREQGWNTVHVDVEGMRSLEEFLQVLCNKIQELEPKLKQILGGIKQRLNQIIAGNWNGNPLEAIGQVDARNFVETLLSSLNEHEKETVIMIDEIALFVLTLLRNDKHAAHDLLHDLRRHLRAYPRVRWLLTGSIGLDIVAERENLSGTMVDHERFILAPFNKIEALSYIDYLSSEGDIPEPFSMANAEFDYLAEELGWLAPFYLKLVADRIRPTGEVGINGHRIAKRSDIDIAFEDLLDPQRRGLFSVWEEHIAKNFEPRETDLLRNILLKCCVMPNGETAPTLLNHLNPTHPNISNSEMMRLLFALTVDGLLQETEGRWQFCSGLVRRYWRKYHHE